MNLIGENTPEKVLKTLAFQFPPIKAWANSRKKDSKRWDQVRKSEKLSNNSGDLGNTGLTETGQILYFMPLLMVL